MFNICKWCNSGISYTRTHFVKFYAKDPNSNLKFLLETMPKEASHILEAQKQRKRIKEFSSKYVPGRVTLQVLGTGAEGAPKSLYVFSEQSRYLFNSGEGTQRLAYEHKMKLSKLEHIFITQSTWHNIGGLPGIALTIQDVGVPNIVLHGPQGLEDLFTATQRFVILKHLQIKTADCGPNSVFKDNVMIVHYVPIIKSRTSKSIVNEGDVYKGVQAACDSMEIGTSTKTQNCRKKSSRSPSPVTSKEAVEDDIDYYAHEQSGRRMENVVSKAAQPNKSVDEEDKVMCYICQLTPRPGALNLDKCVKYGVPAGPLLGKLKMGEDVTLQSGVVVRSKDVREPDDPGPVFLVVDCPSEEYLESFVTNPAFKKHQAEATDNDMLAYLVVHFTPPHVMNDERYCKWIDKFSPSTHHLVLNETNTCMGSIAIHKVQYKLNLLHDSIFPLLGDKGSKYNFKNGDLQTRESSTVENNVKERNTTVLEKLSNSSYTHVNTFCNFHLRPKTGLDRSTELTLTPSEYVDETMKVENFPTILTELQQLITQQKAKLVVRPYPRFLFLGTGSCIPNKIRNTSGILFQADENTNILVDCGEGTYGQIVRFFGPNMANEVLANIKAIYISHLHADHHIGLVGALKGRRKAMKKLGRETYEPLLLLAPKQILTWLNFYNKHFENICQEFELVPNSDLLHDEQTLFEGTKARVFLTLGMSDISTTYVRHCPNAFGVAFTSKNGYKICYSGDTMPSENLINLGVNCDLLIHEATMEDELENEAIFKMHSTTSQAIEVGKNMSAKFILLTHFSQRYAKVPRFNDNFGDNVGIAFDNMQVCLDELPLIPLMYPALRLMFAEHIEDLETKAIKRQLKMERQEMTSPSTTKPKQLKLDQLSLLQKLESSLFTDDREIDNARGKRSPTKSPQASHKGNLFSKDKSTNSLKSNK